MANIKAEGRLFDNFTFLYTPYILRTFLHEILNYMQVLLTPICIGIIIILGQIQIAYQLRSQLSQKTQVISITAMVINWDKDWNAKSIEHF